MKRDLRRLRRWEVEDEGRRTTTCLMEDACNGIKCVTDPIRVIDDLILAIIRYSNWNWVDDTQLFENEKVG
jgi:hypothetical protein|tara:strand:- start:249 stop:461 length:213 start_codon:yes stop_codon:yes gene_type:complete